MNYTKESHTRKEGASVAGRRQMIVSFYFSRKYPSKRQKSERNTYWNGSFHKFLSDKHNSLITNNLSNQENWSKSKKLNDFSSITPAIWVHQPAGKAAAVQAKVSDEKFVKSFDCFATSFRSFHFVSFEASECKWIKGRIRGIFFQDKHKWKYRIDRDFKWFSPCALAIGMLLQWTKSVIPWRLLNKWRHFINYQVN